ncbi:type 1 glutamine amidotransferase domain-containing protein [Geminicoccus roseus]|uniref:type 1 glutamine amidotransferase domain-containing protein n=1 Tax=Geminicoccus roseus TaxID=404900 RepID=UPI0004285D38|nr:type 1 glutamine amidotransferase domain-containing protein [Geminicoccus roseus]
MKVLMILTSHDQLGDTGHKTGFWLEELAAPYYVFKDAGAEITLASPKGGQPPLDPKSSAPDSQTEATRRFEADDTASAQLASTEKLSEVQADRFDALFIPGGHGPMWDLAGDATSIKLIENFVAASKPLAAICHGPAALTEARRSDGAWLVQGRKVTGFTNGEEAAVGLEKVVPFLLEDRLQERGGVFRKKGDFEPHVEVDGQLVTGQNPASSEPAARALLELAGRGASRD